VSLVALGDSITVGGWARRAADALGLGYEGHARDGAVVADVLRLQLPRVTGHHAVATLYAGVNDARGPRFDPAAFERDLALVADALARRADRLLLCTMPLDLGRPTAAPKPVAANAAIRRVAAAAGAVLCALDDLAGPELVAPDAVHPTARGQEEIAARAVQALRAASTSDR
jgi:lysophospholipase L1-like esterase